MGEAKEPVRFTTADALAALARAGDSYTVLFRHGTLEIEIYRPVGVDKQQPHTRDELYVVIAGKGWFVRGEERVAFGPGDVLFVRARVPHRFVDFSEDFSTWVFFWGPEGGEAG